MSFSDDKIDVAVPDIDIVVGYPRTCNLDAKRRFTVSAEWRGCLGSSDFIYVMPDLELKCLNLLSPEEMKTRLGKLRERKLSEKGFADALRVLGASSELLKLDGQRRVRVCDRLLKFANIEDKVVLAASVTCVQVWAPSLYPEEEELDQEKFAAALKLLDI